MKAMLFGVLCLIAPVTIYGQATTLAGTWEIYEAGINYSNPIGRVQVGSDISVTWYGPNGQDYWNDVQAKNNGCSAREKSLENSTSLMYVWAYECTSSDTVEARTLTVTSLGPSTLFLGNLQMLKTLKKESTSTYDCFYKSGKCDILEQPVVLRPPPSRVVLQEQLFVGSSTHDAIQIQEIRFTSKAIEVLLLFKTAENSYTGALNPPGSEKAFLLRDVNGNTYKLKNQYGWLGEQAGGFGSFTIAKDSEKLLLLYFEPASNASAVTNLNLLEGACETGCWNFYDIRLKD